MNKTKARHYLRVCAVIIGVFSLLASQSYATEIVKFNPEWKPWIATIGGFAAGLLEIVRSYVVPYFTAEAISGDGEEEGDTGSGDDAEKKDGGTE